MGGTEKKHPRGAGRKPGRPGCTFLKRSRARAPRPRGRPARAVGDAWIAGQRVRYLVESGRTGDAVRAAEACRAAGWWCWALGGLALHAAGEYPAADSAFDAALALMPAEERCQWSDLSSLLEGDLRKRYRALPCEERDRLGARLWWLARPLLSQAGNDRRSEHFTRLMVVRLMRGARTAYGLSWGGDLAEITLRYGWPRWWAQAPPRAMGLLVDPIIAGHETTPGFHFFPPARGVRPAAAPWGPLVLSLELTTATSHHVARARYGWRPAPAEARVTLSDLLLFDPAPAPAPAPDSVPVTLESAAPRAHGSGI